MGFPQTATSTQLHEEAFMLLSATLSQLEFFDVFFSIRNPTFRLLHERPSSTPDLDRTMIESRRGEEATYSSLSPYEFASTHTKLLRHVVGLLTADTWDCLATLCCSIHTREHNRPVLAEGSPIG